MKILDRLIARQVIAGTVVALLALLALFTFVALVDELGNVGKGSYDIVAVLEYLLWTSPTRAFLLFPLAALLGSLVGLGNLSSHFELAVMRASGYSVGDIVAAVLKGGAVMMIAAVLLGELGAPAAERHAQALRSAALDRALEFGTYSGFWARDGHSFINIGRVLPDDDLRDVTIYEFDDMRRLRVATRARAARHLADGWQLEGVTQTVFGKDSVTVRSLERAAWESSFEPGLVEVVAVKPESLSALGLVHYSRYLRANGLDASRFELALWNKLVYPLATGVMIFLSVPLVLGRLGTGRVGQRVLVGVLAGIAFHVINRTSGEVGVVYGLSPFGSAVLPTAAFFLFGLWRLGRVR